MNPIRHWVGQIGLVGISMVFSPVYAQLDNAQHAISVKTSYGVDIDGSNPNRSANYLYGLHVSYDKNIARSDREWVRFIHAKNLSFGLTWHNLNPMKEVVDGVAYSGGQAIGALAEVDIQLLKLGNARLFLTPGMGLAYLTETVFTQPATSTIGSHINMSLTGELSIEAPISPNTSVVVAGHIQHYSNGAIKVPNGGWNAVVGSVGLKTVLGEATATSGEPEAYHHLERHNVEAWIGAGFRAKYRDKREKFYRTGAYAGYNFFLNRALSLKAGSHLVYYHTVFDIDQFDETFQYYGSSYDRIRWGLAAGADLTMGRFVFNAMYGKYLHYRNFHDVKWYWVFGTRYYFTPHIGIQNTLNLHGAQADYMNWGLIGRF